MLDFSNEQVYLFEKILYNNYDKYAKTFPPIIYINRLIDIMKTGKRLWKCYLPSLILSIDGYGNFESCPMGRIPNIPQNIFIEESENLNILTNFYRVKQTNDYLKCRYCITQYEMLNLYV